MEDPRCQGALHQHLAQEDAYRHVVMERKGMLKLKSGVMQDMVSRMPEDQVCGATQITNAMNTAVFVQA